MAFPSAYAGKEQSSHFGSGWDVPSNNRIRVQVHTRDIAPGVPHGFLRHPRCPLRFARDSKMESRYRWHGQKLFVGAVPPQLPPVRKLNLREPKHRPAAERDL